MNWKKCRERVKKEHERKHDRRKEDIEKNVGKQEATKTKNGRDTKEEIE